MRLNESVCVQHLVWGLKQYTLHRHQFTESWNNPISWHCVSAWQMKTRTQRHPRTFLGSLRKWWIFIRTVWYGYGYYAQLEKSYPNPSKLFFFFFLICLATERRLKSKNVRGKTSSVFHRCSSEVHSSSLLSDNQTLYLGNYMSFSVLFCFLVMPFWGMWDLDPPTRGLNPHPLQWEYGVLTPLDHQGSPEQCFRDSEILWYLF